MSARKVSSLTTPQQQVTVDARKARLSLSHEAVVIHKNGIEFRSPTPFILWNEMTIELRRRDNRKIHCAGVVIGCTGNKHVGYHISMVFTNVSRQAQSRLTQMSAASLG